MDSADRSIQAHAVYHQHDVRRVPQSVMHGCHRRKHRVGLGCYQQMIDVFRRINRADRECKAPAGFQAIDIDAARVDTVTAMIQQHNLDAAALQKSGEQ